MITILATIFVFGIIVFIHELGHFITAKLCNMRVDEFAIGFGPTLIKKQKGETLYSIRIIPLGGFNKIAGMDPDEPQDNRSFNAKPAWQRFIVIAAGATFNFLLAIVLFFLIFVTYGVGTPSSEAVIGHIAKDSPAAAAHLEENDKILTINNKPVAEWNDISKNLSGSGNTVVPIIIERAGERQEVSVIPKESNGRALLGINPVINFQHYSIGESANMAVTGTWHMIGDMLVGLKTMVTGSAKAEVAGPIGVAQMAGQIAQVGFMYLLQFTAVLSVNLGIINLLPIPVLDGGHLIFILIEGITRRKLPSKALYYIQMVGMALLLFIFVYATTSDISRLF